MARMIPAVLDRNDTPSPGERLLFDFLKYAPGTTDWVVFHSQRLAYVEKKPQGEADFVVCVPGYGILVLEVKASNRIVRRGGKWLYGPEEAVGQNPFKQASDAMFAIRNALERRLPNEVKHILFSSAVVFTHVSSIPETDEWRPDEVIDATSMLPENFAAAVRASLAAAATHLAHTTGMNFEISENPRAAKSALSLGHLEAIERVLRPSFEAVLTPAERGVRHQQELLRLTAEQYRALDEMANNNRVLFEGPAGTGKTLLAIEAARRALDLGDRVLLVCHNRGLADYLRTALEDRVGDSLFVGSIHSYLMHVTGLEVPANSDQRAQFFRTTLPDAALDVVTRGGAGGFDSETQGFDTIVVDELQDILSEEYLQLIPQFLRTSPGKDGNVFLFGDIENQAFFDNRDPGILRQLLRSTLGALSFRNLTVNCRNAPEVVSLVEALFDVRPAYTYVPPRAEHYSPEYKRYTTHPEKDLVKILNGLDNSGHFRMGVTVLSLVAESDSVASRLSDGKWKPRLRALGHVVDGKSVVSTSVYRFKGLESPIVILTDIDLKTLESRLEGLYVGITRSTLMTILLIEEQAAEALARKVVELQIRRMKEQR